MTQDQLLEQLRDPEFFASTGMRQDIVAAADAIARLTAALERIALLDEADGHELTARHAHEAVAIATTALGKHPAEILAARSNEGRKE